MDARNQFTELELLSDFRRNAVVAAKVSNVAAPLAKKY